VPRAFARSAALAAINIQSFFNSLDNERVGKMSTGKLFQNLKLMIGEGEHEEMDSLAASFKGLTDSQVRPKPNQQRAIFSLTLARRNTR
jgi:hypothetical protein